MPASERAGTSNSGANPGSSHSSRHQLTEQHGLGRVVAAEEGGAVHDDAVQGHHEAAVQALDAVLQGAKEEQGTATGAGVEVMTSKCGTEEVAESDVSSGIC